MITTISFDLDGTLVKSTYADAVWLEGLPQLYAEEKQITVNEAKQIMYKEYDLIGENRKEWYDIAWWFHRFRLNGRWQDLLESYRSKIQVYADAQETIQNLASSYQLIIVSNAKREFIEIQLEETQLRQYFSRVFSSLSDFHQVKKIPQVYQKLCRILHVKPQDLVHIGDHQEFDYQSPQTIGIRAYFLDREGTQKGEHVLHTLSDLNNILDKKEA